MAEHSAPQALESPASLSTFTISTLLDPQEFPLSVILFPPSKTYNNTTGSLSLSPLFTPSFFPPGDNVCVREEVDAISKFERRL